MIHVCYEDKCSSENHYISFREEEIAANSSVEGLERWIRDQAIQLYPEKQQFIENCNLLLSVPKEDDSTFYLATAPTFWAIYSQFFPEWVEMGNKVREAAKAYKGKKVYWEIDPSSLKVAKKEMDKPRYYDFRTSLLSGNCFATRREAVAFKQKMTEEFWNFDGGFISDEDLEHSFFLSADEMIHWWSWDCCDCIMNPLHPVISIYPLPFSEWIGLDDEEYIDKYRQNGNIFIDSETAEQATSALWKMFYDRGFYFKGTKEEEIITKNCSIIKNNN